MKRKLNTETRRKGFQLRKATTGNMKTPADGASGGERSPPKRSALPRRLVLASLLALIAAYLVWRVVFTLNYQYLAFSIIFFLADCLTAFSTVGLIVSLWDVRVSPPAPAPAEGLTVDVLIPTYNESIDILRRTISSCVRLDYPHRTWVLDDGNRPAVRELAVALGASYLFREKNEHGKAGNLNNALQHTDGDFIAVFDADFIPRRDFLTKLLGYFQDPGIALAQAPQHYYNRNSFQHRRLGKTIWNEQSSFFDVIMQGKNSCNAVFWIGTNAVLRRRAVEEVGGFAVESVTEDMLTSIRIHARGWRSVYVNEPLAHGLAPVNIRQFLIQRLRWAKGASQIFFGHNPLFRKGLGMRQRLSYLFSVMHFFDGWARLVYYLLPSLYLLFGISPVARDPIVLWVIVGYILTNIVTLYAVTRRSISFFNDELYAMVRFLTYLIGNLTVFFRRRVKFSVTPKDQRAKNTTFLIFGPAAMFCLNVTALLSKGFLFLHGGFTSPLFLFALILCSYFALVALAALIVSFSRPRTDSFAVHDNGFLMIAAPDGGPERAEICPVKGWNEAIANVLSLVSRPRGGELIVNAGEGDDAIEGIRARIAKKAVHRLRGGFRLYEYELAFRGLPENDKLRLIDLVFQQGLMRQEWDTQRWSKLKFAPILVADGGEALSMAGQAGRGRFVVRHHRPVPAGSRLTVAFPARPGKRYDFKVRSCVRRHGGVVLIGSIGRKPRTVREVRLKLPASYRRTVDVVRLLPIVAVLAVSAFLLNFAYQVKGRLFRETGAIAPPASGVVAGHGNLQVLGGRLCDERGDPIRLRGLSSHGPQWFPFAPEATIGHAVDFFGLDVIRVAVYVEAFKNGRFWNGYVAQPDYMLGQLDMMVRDAINAGVYVIITWHIHSDPLDYYSEAVEFFSRTSARWGGYPNVLFEIANEPEGGIPWTRIRRYAAGVPGVAGGGIIDVIRRRDPDDRPNVVIVGTPTWSQRVDQVLDDPLSDYDNIMYSLHFYAAFHKQEVRNLAQKAVDAGLPIFVTEWGTSYHLSNGPMDLESSRQWLDWMDRYDLSWVNWSLSICDETTALLKPTASMAGPWTDADLTPSGRFVKGELQKTPSR